MAVLKHKNVPHKAPPFSPWLWVRSPFSHPRTFSSSPPPPLPTSDAALPLTYSIFLTSSLLPLLLCNPPIPPPTSPTPLLLLPPSLPPQGQLVCVELTTRQLLHCLLSPSSCPLHNNTQPRLANHRPQSQQYRTPTWPIGEEVWGKEAPVV